MNKKTISAAVNGAEFFAKFPNVMDEFVERIRKDGVAGIFSTAKDLLKKEFAEKESSAEEHKDLKAQIRTEELWLRHAAHDLSDVINGALSIEEIKAEVVLDSKKNLVEKFEDFLNQIATQQDFIDQHEILKKGVKNFQKTFESYRNNLAKIGPSADSKQEEAEEAHEALIQEHPFISAANAATRSFLKYTNHAAYLEFKRLHAPKRKVASESGRE